MTPRPHRTRSIILFAFAVFAESIFGVGVCRISLADDGPKIELKRKAVHFRELNEASGNAAKTEDAEPRKDAAVADEQSDQKWVRLHRDASGKPVAMQTAIVRYHPENAESKGEPDVFVDLIGAIHVGDRAYYEKLNERFKDYDVLLYELVAPPGTVVEKGRGTSNAHPVGALQNGMKGVLGLEHQLELIDYTAENFVHADMSPTQMSSSMAARGESFMQMYFRLIGAEMARQSRAQAKGESAEFGMLMALFSPDRDRRLKIVLAEQFQDIEGMMAGLSGPDGSTLITERNKVAFDVLRAQLGEGKKRIGVFYGAGHLADMDVRMRNEFNMSPGKTIWIDAWNLR